MSPRHSDRDLLESINTRLAILEQIMSANDDALTALTAATVANTAATNAAVLAIGSESDDISAGVNAQTEQIAANTTALTDAVTPAPASSTPAAPAADVPPVPGAVVSPTEAAIAAEAANTAATDPHAT